MATVARGEQCDGRVGFESVDFEYFKRDQRIILRRNDESRHTDRSEEVTRGLRGIVIRSRAKSKKGRSETIVELPNRFHGFQPIQRIKVWEKCILTPDPFAQPAEKAARVNKI